MGREREVRIKTREVLSNMSSLEYERIGISSVRFLGRRLPPSGRLPVAAAVVQRLVGWPPVVPADRNPVVPGSTAPAVPTVAPGNRPAAVTTGCHRCPGNRPAATDPVDLPPM